MRSYKKALILLMVLLMATGVSAASQVVDVLNGDANYLYSAGSTIDIEFTISDADEPGDVNVTIFYVPMELAPVEDEPQAWVEISGAGGNDANLMNFCTNPNLTTVRPCVFTWTLPANIDTNILIDVNTHNITDDEQVDANSDSMYMDTNACTTIGGTSLVSGRTTVTLTTTCSGYGADGNFGAPVTEYNTNRTTSCGDGFVTYSAPFTLTLGQFTVCYRSTDSLGNSEGTTGLNTTADGNTFNLLLLVEVVLAAFVLIMIAGFLAVTDRLNPEAFVMLVTGAIVVTLLILVYAAIL